MRVNHFVLAAGNTSQAGHTENFTTGSIDIDIRSTDTVMQSATARGESDDDPYGNVNFWVSSRTVTGGEAEVEFAKSAPTGNTTDSIDSIIFSAR